MSGSYQHSLATSASFANSKTYATSVMSFLLSAHNGLVYVAHKAQSDSLSCHPTHRCRLLTHRVFDRTCHTQTAGAPEASARLAQQEQALHSMKKLRIALESQLFDPRTLTNAAQFYNFVAAWLVKMVDPEDKGLPLATPSMEFSCLPEFCVEDVALFFINCQRYVHTFTQHCHCSLSLSQ
jgi:hypothetical protein